MENTIPTKSHSFMPLLSEKPAKLFSSMALVRDYGGKAG